MIVDQEKDGAPIFLSLAGESRASSPYISPDLLIVEFLTTPSEPDYEEPIGTKVTEKGA